MPAAVASCDARVLHSLTTSAGAARAVSNPTAASTQNRNRARPRRFVRDMTTALHRRFPATGSWGER